LVGPGKTEDEVMEIAIEAGASDVIDLEEDGFEVRTALADLHEVGDALQAAGLPVGERKLIYAAKTPVEIGEEQLEQVLKLVDMLEECDDVQEIHANFETA